MSATLNSPTGMSHDLDDDDDMTVVPGATSIAPSTSSLERPFAVVTGGSSGIGKELARQFAMNGFDVLICAEDSDALQAAASELSSTGASIQTIATDLATGEGVHALYEKLISFDRPLEAIAINAGVGVGGAFTETSLDDEMNLINLNVASTVHLAKHIVRDMVERGSGRILFTASVASVMPAPFEAVYGASKAFILSFAEALRNELKDTGVSVTALMPGPTETNFFHRADMDDTKAGAMKKDDPADVAKTGFEALMAGKDKVIAGNLKNRIQGHLAEVLPDEMVAGQHRKLSEPGSANS